MKIRKIIKASLVIFAAFSVLIISLAFFNPNSKLRNFIFEEEKETSPISSYTVSQQGTFSTSLKTAKSPQKNETSSDDIYANQILNNNTVSGYNGIYCSICSGDGEKDCTVCYATGIMDNGEMCTVCFGDGKLKCENCNNGYY